MASKTAAAMILRGRKPDERPAWSALPPADFAERPRQIAKQETGSTTRTDLMSYLMYPDVFLKFARARAQYGELEVLPTPPVFLRTGRARRSDGRTRARKDT